MKSEPRMRWHFSHAVPAVLSVLLMGAVSALAAPAASTSAYGADGGRSGRDIVEANCARCHQTGEKGAPKIGDREAWAKRAEQGLTGLTKHALAGIRKMPAHGGNPGLSDLDIERAITYMVNQSGGHWIAPVGESELAKERTGEQVVKAQCVKCHEAGVGGAPRIGDHAAWVPRFRKGLDLLVRSAIRGHGGMPPRGGKADLTDAELQSAVLYMFNPVPATTSSPQVAEPAPAPVGGMEKVVGGLRIFVGFKSAESLKQFPAGSVERRMHGGVPEGSGYYHVNVSLFDRVTNAPIQDATVDVQVAQLGFSGESTKLERMPLSPPSYGAYLHVPGHRSYEVTLHISTADTPGTVDWTFAHSF